jgi:hypothetical protein
MQAFVIDELYQNSYSVTYDCHLDPLKYNLPTMTFKHP